MKHTYPQCFFVHTLIDVVKDNREESLKKNDLRTATNGVYILHVSARHF